MNSIEEKTWKWLPAGLSLRISIVLGALGVPGLLVAPFLPTKWAVIVINEVSMVTLIVAGIAAIESARNP